MLGRPARTKPSPVSCGAHRHGPRPAGNGTSCADSISATTESAVARRARRRASLVVQNALLMTHAWALKQWHVGRLVTLEQYVQKELSLLLEGLRIT